MGAALGVPECCGELGNHPDGILRDLLFGAPDHQDPVGRVKNGCVTIRVRVSRWPAYPYSIPTSPVSDGGTLNHTGTTSNVRATVSSWKGSVSSEGVGGGSSAMASQGGGVVSAGGVGGPAPSLDSDTNDSGRERLRL